ncbi:hypothetical protein T08_3862 [Trichinella sp. T8]|nr:hypothetical protein T08_3862 [Trichinella sp. T8]
MSHANKYSVSKRHAGFSSSPLLKDLRFVFCVLGSNTQEGWHFRMNRHVCKHHLSIYELLQLMID